MKALGRMPPLLVINGQRDRWVSYKKYVEPLFSYLEQHHIAYQSRVYPKDGHKFKPAELEDVRTQAIEFFRQHLKPTVSTTASSQKSG
jgi:predicted esterase